MTTRDAVLCALCIAALLFDQGCCAAGNCYEDEDMTLQHPRFIAIRKGRTITMNCGCGWTCSNHCHVSWFREDQNGSVVECQHQEPRVTKYGTSLTIKNVQIKDNGVYFCSYNTSTERKKSHCGTELRVGFGNAETAKTRNTVKDTIIVIQTVLIVLFIVVPISLLREMNKKRSLKIEDHTYEGLEAYQHATYEDIQTVRAMAVKTMEGEHPCLE